MTDDQPKIYEYEIAEGQFHVKILAAKRKMNSTYTGWKTEWVEELRARVKLATDPEFEGRVSHGFVKVRGRKYAAEHTVIRLGADGYLGQPQTWERESTYGGRTRNEQGQGISYETKAYESIREIEFEVLDRFEKDHPDWARESYRLLFEQHRDNKQSEAKRLRQEATSADREARDWQKRIDDLNV
ncbi:hypothetical protein ASD97_09985 [Streptomyces sp. Root63]|uniref:hypothetical protein n=1 Tax=unclassified Streptomyces TaxID=2593676 RepID=UPI0006FD5665|nr:MULTISPECIES: hypothetical protein [unclassified Streptomyces]KQX37009.1 hypothetical protein ASD29_07245 [Streptomyces sp. Root1295]KRA43930.1 hypothetical protein ASD97_09985 [Streptomyces sp. Root63]